MKRKTCVVAILAVLFAALLSGEPMQATGDQLDGLPYDPPVVTVLSPLPNRTVHASEAPVNVSVQIFGYIYHNIEKLNSLNYSLDEQTAVPLAVQAPSELEPGYIAHGNGILTGLSDGKHNLTVYGETQISGLTENFNQTVTFWVDTSSSASMEPIPIVPIAAVACAVALITVFCMRITKRKKGKKRIIRERQSTVYAATLASSTRCAVPSGQ
jgi:hypothetical protein